MTFSESVLLRKLKKAQIEPDRDIYINFEAMTLTTCGSCYDKKRSVSISRYKGSIRSILESLKKKEYIEHSGEYIHVTHSGWCAFQATVRGALRFTAKDIIVPLIVASIAAWGPKLIELLNLILHKLGA